MCVPSWLWSSFFTCMSFFCFYSFFFSLLCLSSVTINYNQFLWMPLYSLSAFFVVYCDMSLIWRGVFHYWTWFWSQAYYNNRPSINFVYITHGGSPENLSVFVFWGVWFWCVSVYLAHAPLNAQQHMYPLYIALDTFPTSSVLPLSQHLIGSIQAINEILPPLWR